MPPIASPDTYSGTVGDPIYGGRFPAAFSRNPSLISFSWPPGPNVVIPPVGGVDAPIHPDVIDMQPLTAGGTWNGKRYWMAFTPFPTSNGDAVENPCVVVSDDGDTWTAPAVNPIFPRPSFTAPANAYNSDTELVYKDGVLYLIWRECFHPGGGYTTPFTETLRYATTTDGVTYSAATQFLQDTSGNRLVSPSITYRSGQWWLWVVNSSVSPIRVELMTAPSISGPWSSRTVTNIASMPGGAESTWHVNVSRAGSGWAMLIGARTGTTPGNHWFSYSADGITWATPHRISSGSPNIYRSAIVESGAGFDCWIGDWDARKIRRLRIDDAQP